MDKPKRWCAEHQGSPCSYSEGGEEIDYGEVDERLDAEAHALTREEVKHFAEDVSSTQALVARDWLRLRDEFDVLLDGFYIASNLFARLKMGLKPTPVEWNAAAKFFNAATDIGEREENWRRVAAGEQPVQHMRLDDDTGLGPKPEELK